MTLTEVSGARKFAVVAFSGVVALSLMLPTQMAHADYYFGDDDSNQYKAGEDASGEGWSYTAEGQQMNLVNYVGESITAKNQDLNVQLEGDSTITDGGISVSEGNLTITGDENKYGEDKPSLTLDGESGYIQAYGEDSNLSIKDANIYADAKDVQIAAPDGNLEIVNSGIYRGEDNESLYYGAYDENSEMTLQGSELNATSVHSNGTMTIDNTNLTVLPNKTAQEMIDAGKYGEIAWVVTAVTAVKGITLNGEANGEVIEYTDENGYTWYYLYTGDDNKVELKASSTPAYYGPTKGMPQTSDTTMPMAMGLSIVAACAAAFTVFSARSRKAEGKRVK